MSAFYDYVEPLHCECRAFGRLHKTGHEELAVRCFGYVQDHKRALHSHFANINFNGDIEYPGGDDMWPRFLGRDGRARRSEES